MTEIYEKKYEHSDKPEGISINYLIKNFIFNLNDCSEMTEAEKLKLQEDSRELEELLREEYSDL